MTRDDIKRIALDVLEGQLYGYGLFRGGSFGYDLDSDQIEAKLDAIAQDIADRVGSSYKEVTI